MIEEFGKRKVTGFFDSLSFSAVVDGGEVHVDLNCRSVYKALSHARVGANPELPILLTKEQLPTGGRSKDKTYLCRRVAKLRLPHTNV